MTNTERLLDNLLDDVAAGKRTSAECLSLCRQSHPELVSALELALALHDSPLDDLPDADMASAQQRIWQSLEAAFDDNMECPEVPIVRWRIPSIPSITALQRRQRWLTLAACAAMFLLLLMGGWAFNNAAAGALPGSPLYAMKRANEDFHLRIAWSSQMRGQMLAQIAANRLAEARAEAARDNNAQALSLMQESDEATTQLINLAITLHSRHEDDTDVQRALATTLRVEYDALNQAQSDGQSAFAQALSLSVADQQQVMSASNIAPPTGASPIPSAPTPIPTVATHPAHPTPAADPTPPAHPTPSAHPTPGSGNGSGSNNGNGSGNGSNNGNSNGNGRTHGGH